MNNSHASAFDDHDGFQILINPAELDAVYQRLAQQLLDSARAANDEMDAEELAALDAAIEESYEDEAAGRVRDVFEAFPQLSVNS